MTDTLIFSHANGFPLPVYRRLLDALRPEFESVGIPRFGHDPSRPATTDWPYLVDELVEYVNALPTVGARVWLVGHSLGGYLSVLAAERLHPRVAGIVMLDSPVIVGARATMLRLGRAFGLDRLVMPLQQTLQRRKHWPDIEATHAHYAVKPAFARWHPDVLRDYAEYGTVPDGRGGRELFFDRSVEYRIYRSLPTSRVAAVGARLDAPVAFIGGRDSRELRHVGLSATRALVGQRLYWVDGGHLFPMESPDATAERIRTAIDAMRRT
ncbi:MAG: alpha/beta hydrolase [Xanthomonadaceae bacterium]|nr:alpha/beta hydrolase [Xanthomonadaceae bacterium]